MTNSHLLNHSYYKITGGLHVICIPYEFENLPGQYVSDTLAVYFFSSPNEGKQKSGVITIIDKSIRAWELWLWVLLNASFVARKTWLN